MDPLEFVATITVSGATGLSVVGLYRDGHVDRRGPRDGHWSHDSRWALAPRLAPFERQFARTGGAAGSVREEFEADQPQLLTPCAGRLIGAPCWCVPRWRTTLGEGNP